MTVYFNPHKKKYEVKHICQYCNKELKSASGKTSHEKSCPDNPDNTPKAVNEDVSTEL